MKVYRYMSMHELKKYLSGETIFGKDQGNKLSSFDNDVCILPQNTKCHNYRQIDEDLGGKVNRYNEIIPKIREGDLTLIEELESLREIFQEGHITYIESPEESFQHLKGTVQDDVLVEFEINENKLIELIEDGYKFKKGYGIYASKYDFDSNVFIAEELAIPFYSKDFFSLSSFSKVSENSKYDEYNDYMYDYIEVVFKSNSLKDLDKYYDLFIDKNVLLEQKNVKFINNTDDIKNFYSNIDINKDIDYMIYFENNRSISFCCKEGFSEKFKNSFSKEFEEKYNIKNNFSSNITITDNEIIIKDLDNLYKENNINEIINMFYNIELPNSRDKKDEKLINDLVEAILEKNKENFHEKNKDLINSYNFINITINSDIIKLTNKDGFWRMEEKDNIRFLDTEGIYDILNDINDSKSNIKITAYKTYSEFEEATLDLKELLNNREKAMQIEF